MTNITYQRKINSNVEAVRFSGSTTSAAAIKHWMETGVYKHPKITTRDYHDFYEKTPKGGIVTANPGDYIVKLRDGSFVRQFANVFESNYELTKEV